jgi:hypothetical protein
VLRWLELWVFVLVFPGIPVLSRPSDGPLVIRVFTGTSMPVTALGRVAFAFFSDRLFQNPQGLVKAHKKFL